MSLIKNTKLFIGNEWIDAASGSTFAIINPTNKQLTVSVSEAGKDDIDYAVSAAKRAYSRTSKWRTMSASNRGELLLKLAAKVEENSEHLAQVICLEVGKPVWECRKEVEWAIKTYRYMSGYADKFTGKLLAEKTGQFGFVKKEPVGIVGAIVSYNMPMVMAAWKLAPALAMGNCVVLKPAEQTPLSVLVLAAYIKEVGFPAGVVNIVPGLGRVAGHYLATHADVSMVSFTGSTHVGKLIMKEASKSIKRLHLALGGNCPAIIFPDADLDLVSNITKFAVFTLSGQMCLAASRIFVHESVYDQFVEKAVKHAKERAAQMGDPTDKGTMQGPLIDETHYNRVMELIESGKSEGAKLEFGGVPGNRKGYYVVPTVFSNVQDNMRIAKEEVGGPVMKIIKFKTKEEVIERANNTKYGLAAAVFTRDLNLAHQMSNSLEAGSVWVNCYADSVDHTTPFGGFKESGLGREQGESALHMYTEEKTVVMELAPTSPGGPSKGSKQARTTGLTIGQPGTRKHSCALYE